MEKFRFALVQNLAGKSAGRKGLHMEFSHMKLMSDEQVVSELELKRALSIPESMGRRGLYKTVLVCGS
jgi:hypothetical protein